MFNRVALCLVTALASSVSRPAFAQDRQEPPPEAVEFFNAGRAHYEAGRYPEAAVSLERALALDPGSAVLLFNLTRVYELLGELDRAVTYGRRYLGMVDEDPPERERAEQTLRRLEGARDWLALRGSAQPPELRQLAPRVIVRERGVADTAFWATLATGGGLTLAGGALGLFALVRHNEAEDIAAGSSADVTRRQDLRDKSQRMALVTDVAVGLGLATMVGALLLYLLRVRTFERTPETSLLPGRLELRF